MIQAEEENRFRFVLLEMIAQREITCHLYGCESNKIKVFIFMSVCDLCLHCPVSVETVYIKLYSYHN